MKRTLPSPLCFVPADGDEKVPEIFDVIVEGSVPFPLSEQLAALIFCEVTLKWKTDNAEIHHCNVLMIAALLANVDFLGKFAKEDPSTFAKLASQRASGGRCLTEFAARGGNAAVLRILHDANQLQPLCPNSKGVDARFVAACGGFVDVLRFFHEVSKVPLDFVSPADGETLLHACVRRCAATPSDDDNIKDPSAAAAKMDEYPASGKRALEVLRFLLEKKAYTNVELKMKDTAQQQKHQASSWGVQTPFALAARYGSREALELLHAHGGSELCLREQEAVKFSLERVTSLDEIDHLDRDEFRVFSRWSTHWPVLEHDEVAERMTQIYNSPTPLVCFKITLERRRSNLNSPIHRAASGCHVAALKFLFDIGFTCAGSKIKGVAGPLYYAAVATAAEEKALSCVKLLCERGAADVNEVDNAERGLTALYGAAWQNRPSIIRYLLGERGASSSIKYLGRSTPLVGAIASNSIDAIKTLLELKADSATPRGTQSPLEYARALKRPAIVALLEAAGI